MPDEKPNYHGWVIFGGIIILLVALSMLHVLGRLVRVAPTLLVLGVLLAVLGAWGWKKRGKL
jgi:hypothetical protein